MKTLRSQTPFVRSIGPLTLAAALLLQLALPGQSGAAPGATNPRGLAFAVSGTNEFTFDTGVLRGTLRAKGRSMGLSGVTHVPSGASLDRSLGLFSHYRLFSTNHRYPKAAWDWPSTAVLRTDGSVEVHWEAAADRPFGLQANYRWAAPNTLDVNTIVTPQTKLPAFEVFLASYFQTNFTNSLVYVGKTPGRADAPGFMAAEQTYGKWLTFPRNNEAARMFQDGRWTYPPNPVDWVMLPPLAKPLGIRRDPATGLTAVLMAPPTDCFAISTPYQTEGHGSMYLSLFGRDVQPGETARVRTRLVILSKPGDAQIISTYEGYLKAVARK